jgi:hypothetical protein
VIFDPENDVLLLRRPGLSYEDICVLREEEEKKKKPREEKEELSEEEIDDDESEKLINDSEVIYRTMAVISTRFGFQAQRLRHIAMDYDSWNAMYSCRFWQSLGQFEGFTESDYCGEEPGR